MIDQVKVKQLKIIQDERGRLMEILRIDDEIFQGFGQVYMTTAYPGIVKAWHYHKKQTDNFSCISGEIKLTLYDARKKSPTKGQINEFILSLDDPKLIQIPANVYHGFKNIGKQEATVVNVISKPYNHKNPDEYKIDPYLNNIPYDWKKG